MEKNINFEENEELEKEVEEELKIVLETQFSGDLKENYLSVIGDIIGKELKPEWCELEASKFGYRSDLYIKTPDNGAVIIENQYGQSDHDHFGKLFTYASNLTEANGSHPVTDVVWILIEGESKPKFNKGHFEAVKFINKFCEGKIKFKIWLLLAENKNGKYTFRAPEENDIKQPGSHEKLKPLTKFMVSLRNEIVKKGYGNPWNGANKGWCLEFNPYQAEDYKINIPYRKSEKGIYIEAKFDRRSKKRQNYAEMLKADNDKFEYLKSWRDKFCEENDIFEQDLDFALEYQIVGTKRKTAKISSFIETVDIDDKDNWENYINELIERLGMVISFADYICEMYQMH